jgi:hypothetical protein
MPAQGAGAGRRRCAGARDQPSKYSSRRPGRHVPIVDQVASFTAAVIRDDGLIEGADPTIAALTGRIDVRFADTTLIDLAAGATPVDLEFAYTLSAQAKLVLCPSRSWRSRARAVSRRASISAARRTTLPGGCSRSRSPTTSMGQCMADRAALRASVPES